VIITRKTSKGVVYVPRVYNPRVGFKQTAGRILGSDVPSSYRTEKDARRVHRRMEDAVENWVAPEDRPITVAEWVERWMAEYPRPKRTTNDSNRSLLRPLVKEYGDVALRDFSREQARTFALAHRPHSKIAKAMFNDAIFEAEIPGMVRNPFDRLKLAPVATKRDIALTAAEIDRLAACSDVLGDWGVVMRAMIIFSAYTGLRLGEMCALEWSWFSEDRKDLEVRRQIDRNGVPTCTKNGQGDTKDATSPPAVISVSEQARDVLALVPRSLAGHVFTHPNGKRLTARVHGRAWRKVRGVFLELDHGSRNLERLVWHSLRHSTSTLMIEQGLSRWDAQIQMRHKTPTLVDGTYTHIAQREARERISAALSSVPRTGLGHHDGAQEAK
jgi:integrase